MSSRVISGYRYKQRGERAVNREKRTYDGILFDSLLEMAHYRDVLKPLINAGRIRDFKYHPVFTFEGFTDDNGNALSYEADFSFLEAWQRRLGKSGSVSYDWVSRVKDVKAWQVDARTGRRRYITGPEYRWQKALMRHCYGIEIEEV